MHVVFFFVTNCSNHNSIMLYKKKNKSFRTFCFLHLFQILSTFFWRTFFEYLSFFMGFCKCLSKFFQNSQPSSVQARTNTKQKQFSSTSTKNNSQKIMTNTTGQSAKELPELFFPRVRANQKTLPDGFDPMGEDYYSHVAILSMEQRLGWREVLSESVAAQEFIFIFFLI